MLSSWDALVYALVLIPHVPRKRFQRSGSDAVGQRKLKFGLIESNVSRAQDATERPRSSHSVATDPVSQSAMSLRLLMHRSIINLIDVLPDTWKLLADDHINYAIGTYSAVQRDESLGSFGHLSDDTRIGGDRLVTKKLERGFGGHERDEAALVRYRKRGEAQQIAVCLNILAHRQDVLFNPEMNLR